MTRSAAALLTLFAFSAVLLIIAASAGRRTHNASDLVLANRRLGVWLVALGYTASATNMWVLLVMGAAAFVWGLSAVWIWGAIVVGCIINMWYVAPRLRAASAGQGNVTLTQMLSADAGERLQPIIVRSIVCIVLLALLLQSAAMLRFAGEVLAAEFGFEVGKLVTLSVALLAACMLAGGLRAASMLDGLQIILVLAVAALLPLPAFFAMGGADQLQTAVAAIGPQATDLFAGRTGVVALAFAAGASGIGLAMLGQPHAATRLMAAKDDATLLVARWLALGCVAVLGGAVLLCAWCAGVLYAGLEHPEQALFVLASRLLPPLLSAAIVAVLAAAIVLGIGSQLLVMAASLAVDLRRASAPVSLAWNRTALIVAAAAAAAVALYAPAAITEHALFGFSALGASLGPLLLVRLSGKRIRPGSILGAMWAGFVLTLLFHLLPDSPGDFLERVLPFIAALGIALTGGERRRNPDRADRSQETVHDRVPI